MPKRYMICPTIAGSTIPPNTPPEDIAQYSNRASVADVSGAAHTALLPVDGTGALIYGFAFCHASHQQVSELASVTNAYVFPDYPLDAEMSGMESATRTALTQSVQAYQLDGTAIDATHLDTDSYGSLITAIAQQFEPVFDIDKFFAPEPQVV